MLTKEQIKILVVFKKDLVAELTFKQIKEQSKQKSNNIVQIALKEFKTQNLIKTKKIGDITIYSLNLDNNLTVSYLNLINEIELSKKNIPKGVLQEIQNRVSKHTEFFILILFGSYAKNKATKKSDIDIAVIIESDQTRKEVSPYLETIKRRELLKIDYHIITKNEFLEMLKSEYENLGKQIFKDNLVYYGFIEYCHLTREKQNE